MGLKEIFERNLKREPNYKASKNFRIKPSSIGGKCLRKIYYDSARVEPDFPFPLAAKKHMKLGDAIHDMLSQTFYEEGISIRYRKEDGTFYKDGKGRDNYEFRVSSEELGIKLGFIDDVYIIDDKLWLGEYKSINTNGFTKLHAPKTDHLVQATIYFYIFNKMLAEGKYAHIPELKGFKKAEGIIFLYVHKDNNDMKEFVIPANDALFQNIVKKIMNVKHHYENKILPEKTQDWCQSCPWRNKCAKNYNLK